MKNDADQTAHSFFYGSCTVLYLVVQSDYIIGCTWFLIPDPPIFHCASLKWKTASGLGTRLVPCASGTFFSPENEARWMQTCSSSIKKKKKILTVFNFIKKGLNFEYSKPIIDLQSYLEQEQNLILLSLKCIWIKHENVRIHQWNFFRGIIHSTKRTILGVVYGQNGCTHTVHTCASLKALITWGLPNITHMLATRSLTKL